MSLIRAENVSKEFKMGTEHLQAVQNVSVSVEPGEFLAITGPSGSGKTTLLHLLGGLELVSSGKIFWDTCDIATLNDNQRSDLRATTVGFVFQTFNLLPVLSAEENVEFPLLGRVSASERRERAREALDRVGLSAYMRHRPAQMSGGQRQRVALARALVTLPRVILADEPTANLDQNTGTQVLDLMQELNREKGLTFVFSTHDSRVMERATRKIALIHGMLS